MVLIVPAPRHCLSFFFSAPHLNHCEDSSSPKERPGPGSRIKETQSMTNITASGNLQLNFIDGKYILASVISFIKEHCRVNSTTWALSIAKS